MVRTQIQLTEEQARALKEVAAERGVSMAELIRQAVDRILEESAEDEKWRRAMALIGRYRGGPSDVSTNHDKYLDEIYG
mgnify:CR=1 FL=1